MELTPVFYTNDLAIALIACRVQCRRHCYIRELSIRIWTI
jgi:hypothetical protein